MSVLKPGSTVKVKVADRSILADISQVVIERAGSDFVVAYNVCWFNDGHLATAQFRDFEVEPSSSEFLKIGFQ